MKIFYFKLNRHIISVLLGLFCATPLLAQTGKTVTGTVKELQVPLVGVMVKEEGTDNSTFTDDNGNYSLILQQDDAKLIFEQLDFPIREEEVLNRSVINVRFTKEDYGIQLKDVVINAGYYNIKDKDRTGSIARVTAKEIENQPVNSILDALQGRVPGLEITPTSGTAGGGYTIRIRGQNSIAAGNNPLFIVDGVPFDTNSMGDTSTSAQIFYGSTINPLNYIDPQSIKSIEVLKDADATAIYGSRGANGVLLITTKKGKATKTSISIDASTTVINPTKFPKLLTTEQYLDIRKKAFANDGVTTYPTTAYDINGTWDMTRYTDWQKLLIGNTAFNHNIRTSINGGNEQTNFMIGANVMKETSVFYGNFAYNKFSFFSTLNHKTANNKLKLQWTTNYGQDKNYLPTQDLTRTARTLVPNAPRLFNEDGSLNWENNTWTNPLAALNASYRNNTRNLNTNLNTSYLLMDNIVLRTNVGYNRSDLDDSQLNPHTIRNPAFGATSQQSNMTKNSGQHEGWLIEPQLDANFNLTASSKLSVLIGGTLNSQTTTKLVIMANGFTDNQLMNVLSAAKNVTIYKDTEEQYKYAALYGRVNYNLHEKYFVNLTGRRDGSSRFGPNHRFANFGAIGAAWLFSKENAFSNSNWLSFGKLRGSYGVTGNDQIGDYQYLNTYNISQNGYDGNILLTTARLYNPDFSWEKNKKLEFALETAFLKNRINLTLNYYQNRSSNQLVGYSLPAITGFTSIQANLNAVVENKGWEMDLQVVPIKSAKFNWSTSFNLTIPKNRLVAFDGLENTSYANMYVIGKSLNSKKMYHLQGINPTTGLYEFTDYNGDGKITAIEDKQQVVSLDPSFYGGFSNSVSYENFNIELFFQFVKKKGFNEFYGTTMPGTMYNQPASVLNQFPNGVIQNYSSGSNSAATVAYSNFNNSDAMVTDTSFIRLKNVSLSYKLPLSKNQSNQYVIYAQGQNLWTWSKYKYGDPEQTTGFLPPLRRISIGFKANF
ncbi:SusC/RagA family TonB-linked outer membrane protein [Empedobacter sp.]|uniref:SusC/RagA family TonB-linked outer membrane protein n=1 Tax=Empedobacter sp. TaxID=1927715 RepID=UPI0028989A57|nr:SusC/RagA family TonB-linked outer membrane protein [Empedobacter sp.]